jgi:hypothetical protein
VSGFFQFSSYKSSTKIAWLFKIYCEYDIFSPCIYKWKTYRLIVAFVLICSRLHSQGRIVAMTLDVEHTVSVVAIKLVGLLYRWVDAVYIYRAFLPMTIVTFMYLSSRRYACPCSTPQKSVILYSSIRTWIKYAPTVTQN